jgi:hypothetical protein
VTTLRLFEIPIEMCDNLRLNIKKTFTQHRNVIFYANAKKWRNSEKKPTKIRRQAPKTLSKIGRAFFWLLKGIFCMALCLQGTGFAMWRWSFVELGLWIWGFWFSKCSFWKLRTKVCNLSENGWKIKDFRVWMKI